jgi:hypothetical protein
MARKVKEYNIQPEDMYNTDEKAFLLECFLKPKESFFDLNMSKED